MNLSDDALSILAFAAYHQLESGKVVREILLEDDGGHKASTSGIDGLKEAGIMVVNGERGMLTRQGGEVLNKIVDSIRSAA